MSIGRKAVANLIRLESEDLERLADMVEKGKLTPQELPLYLMYRIQKISDIYIQIERERAADKNG